MKSITGPVTFGSHIPVCSVCGEPVTRLEIAEDGLPIVHPCRHIEGWEVVPNPNLPTGEAA